LSTYTEYQSSQKLTRVGENLYRNGGGKYFARFHHEGKSYKKSLDTHDRKTAEGELAKFVKKIEQKEELGPDATFDAFADEWLAVIKPRMKESSYARRVCSINQLKPGFKGRKLRTIKVDDLHAWELSRAGVSARTFNVDRETLRLVFEYAVKPRRILSVNLIDKASLPKRKEKKAVIMPPTHKQFLELLKTIKANKFTRGAYEYVEMLAYTGLRLEEINNVTWADVDFTKNLLRVTGGEYGTKNHSQRSIPLFAPAKNLLASILDNKKPSDMPQGQTIFAQRSARTAMQTACKVMGLEETAFTHHDLRHFFCTNAIEKNIPDHVIASWLGHKDGGILVKKTYGHLRAGHSAEMAKLMDFSAN
jgi:integrase